MRILALQLQQEILTAGAGTGAGAGAATTGAGAAGAGAAGAGAAAVQEGRLRVAHMALGLWRYYSQFLPLVRSFQDLLRQPILTKLRDEVSAVFCVLGCVLLLGCVLCWGLCSVVLFVNFYYYHYYYSSPFTFPLFPSPSHPFSLTLISNPPNTTQPTQHNTTHRCALASGTI